MGIQYLSFEKTSPGNGNAAQMTYRPKGRHPVQTRKIIYVAVAQPLILSLTPFRPFVSPSTTPVQDIHVAPAPCNRSGPEFNSSRIAALFASRVTTLS